MNELLQYKSPIRAAQNKQRGRMQPVGRQFDMPVLEQCSSSLLVHDPILDLINLVAP